jgi:two-component system chemotaxis response regulator CheB
MPRTTRNIIVVGASAGGLPALKQLVGLLPRRFDASIFVVTHLQPDSRSWLPDILNRSGPLPAVAPDDRTAIERGRIYVAQPDRHLLVEGDVVRVVRGPQENRHRPSVDVLFRSAAWSYGPRVIGVVLSGYLSDGTAGLWAVKTCGGVAIVQDPADAINPQMPSSAARHIDVDHILPVSEIGPLLLRMAQEPIELPETFERPAQLKTELEFAKMEADISDMETLGKLSYYTCPSCQGALWELDEGGRLRYRCHTGHAFSQESLLDEQSAGIETALYSALRAVEEKAGVLRRLRDRHGSGPQKMKQDFEDRARELDRTADVLRSMLSRTAA